MAIFLQRTVSTFAWEFHIKSQRVSKSLPPSRVIGMSYLYQNTFLAVEFYVVAPMNHRLSLSARVVVGKWPSMRIFPVNALKWKRTLGTPSKFASAVILFRTSRSQKYVVIRYRKILFFVNPATFCYVTIDKKSLVQLTPYTDGETSTAIAPTFAYVMIITRVSTITLTLTRILTVPTSPLAIKVRTLPPTYAPPPIGTTLISSPEQTQTPRHATPIYVRTALKS